MKAGEKAIGIIDRVARALGIGGNSRAPASAAIVDYIMRGYAPGLLGRTITDIPEIRTAVNSIAERVASVPWSHIRVSADGSYQPLTGPIHNALSLRPNPFNTPQSNMTLMVTRLLLYNNAYILPEWDDSGSLKWLWPLPFATHEVVTKDNGEVYLKFIGAPGGYEFPWQDIIHLQRFPTGKAGVVRQATGNYETILNAIEQQAVTDSANSNKLSILLQPARELKSETAKAELKKFRDDYLTVENTTGYGMLPNNYTIKEVQPKNTPLNVQMLQIVTAALYSYFGTSSDIVNLKATEQEYIQYVDGTIKPIVAQIEQEFTYKLCSPLEIAKGQRIQANLIDLEIANTRDKTQFLKEMAFAGMMSPNEGRILMGLPKGDKQLDKIQQSKNFTTLEPGQYQVKGGENKDDGSSGDSEKV